MELVATSGPLAGTSLPLTDGMTIGHSGPGVVSRPCCRVTASDGRFVLHVTNRRVPVFVNGLSVTMRRLEPFDELRIGESFFVVRAVEPVPCGRLQPCEARLHPLPAPRVLHALHLEDALLSGNGSAAPGDSREQAALLRAVGALTSVRGLAALDAALAGMVLDMVAADRAAFIDRDDGAAVIRSAWRAHGGASEPAQVDPDALARIQLEQVALALEGGGRQVVAAPMLAYGRTAGVIWVETSGDRGFDRQDVGLMLVIGALAASTREHAREAARLREHNDLLKAEINVEHNLVGRGRPMQALVERIGRVSRTDATVLLRGESGTGKELVARAIHRNSARSLGAFVAINCAALTESLLESELFGHEKGAFTGAIALKKGKMELADGGTLFLDEIGELPLTLQAKLLRALQEREFERVGGSRTVRADFRLVAATNRDLDAAVLAGAFRQDLFYRLNVVAIVLPPLRERREDLPLLAEYFVRKHARRCGRRVHAVAPEALALLERHDWPGNVRELENVIEQALVLGTADTIVADDLPPGMGRVPSTRTLNYHDTMERVRRELIVEAFERAGNSHAGAARLLGVHPNYLHRLLRNLDLRAQVHKRAARSSSS